MPLFSDLSNLSMYYSGSPSATYNPYTTATGGSYSSSYLGSGGNYSNHSSLASYSRPPIASRWVPAGRNYSPLLTTISERGTSTPVRVNSPRRFPLSSQYSPASYVPRPININTADIDVSRERYRARPITTSTGYVPASDVAKSPIYSTAKEDVPKKSAPKDDIPKSSDDPPSQPSDDGPFMPRIDGKTGSGDDNSPGLQRSTIRRGRTVVRLHTLKRKERDSPRKAQEELSQSENTPEDLVDGLPGSNKSSPKGSGWREKLSEDLIYKDKRERKTPGEKLIEKFILKEKNDDEGQISRKSSPNSDSSPPQDQMLQPKKAEVDNPLQSKSPDRRCSMELLAEQANVLDTLIREENLSTACLDLSKIGTKKPSPLDGQNTLVSSKKRRSIKNSENRLQTTQSDHSLHERVKSLGLSRDQKSFSRKSSLKKSVSGGNICRLDSIVELSKEPLNIKLASIDENRVSLKVDKLPTKLKQKTKITSTVDVSQTHNPLKIRVENVTVEQKLREPRKEINFSSVIEEKVINLQPEMDQHNLKRKMPEKYSEEDQSRTGNNPLQKSKSIRKVTQLLPESDEAEADECNFWDKIGKRETIYLKKRKQQLQEELVQSRRAIYWYPEDTDEGESGINEDLEPLAEQSTVHSSVNEPTLDTSNITVEKATVDKKEQKQNIESQELVTPDIETVEKITIDVSTTDNNVKAESLDVTREIELIQDNSSGPQNRLENIVSSNKTSSDIENNSIEIENNIQEYQPQSFQNKELNYVNKEGGNAGKNANDSAGSDVNEPIKAIPASKHNANIKAAVNDKRKDLKSQLDAKSSDKQPETSFSLSEPFVEETSSLEKMPKQLTPKDSSDFFKSDSVCKRDNSIKGSSDTVHVLPIIPRQEIEGTLKVDHTGTDISEIKDIPEPPESVPENIPNTAVVNLDSESAEVTENKLSSISKEGDGSQNDPEKDSLKNVVKVPASPMRKPVKDEPMVRPLIAKPRPLQKRLPQVVHSSSSSDTSSDDDSDDEEADESSNSEGSTEFYECENTGQDGRTSTGSNDSGFDSSAPTSPAGFVYVKKDCDVNCHRKCEKLTANLCGVNQRLLVEALATRTASRRGGDSAGASTSASVPNSTVSDSVEAALEASTAYGVFRRTGRVTPPAKSIPRFRKYTIEDFHFLKVLGKGSFGKVLLAELRDTEYYYAVKCLKKDVVLEDDDVECTLIERKVLALGTNHPYLCHLFATFQTDSHLFFVMEYLNGGDLMFHIQQSGRFPEPRAKFYAAEIVSGLKFLHKRGIVYRDLKLDNILLDYEGHVRIADFGMCKLQIYLEKTADTFCGTPDYMAPEIIKGLKYNQTVDWWSFGVLLYEMLIGQSPFSGCDEDELFWSICNELPSYPRFLSPEAHTILVRLLDKDARTRLGGTDCMHGDVRDQDFFHSIHWERLDRRELESPFRPRVRHPYDTQYFDRAFTGERPRLTAVEPNVLRTMDQQPFRGFSYTNPNATDH